MGVTIPSAAGEVKEVYEISNSLRFNDGDSPSLDRTPSSEGNRKTFTFSTWVKRSKIGGQQTIFLAYGAQNNLGYVNINFATNNQINIGGWSANWLTTTAVFRDPSAWYHIVWAVDTTDSTANDRIKLYVNGTQITDFSTRNNPDQNDDFAVNDDVAHNIGSRRSKSDDDYFDGYMTEAHLVDGTAKAPTDFGEFDDNGVWIPKRYTGAYGTNGFFLQFKQTGTSANSSGIGADTSGNDHHWTSVNLAATDVTTDTCTNNFATLNFVDGSYNSNLSEGNLVLDTSGGGSDIFGRGTIGVSQGKWYFEVKSIINGGHGNRKIVGIVDPETPVAHPRGVTANPYTGVLVDLYDGDVFRNASGASDSGSYSTNDILGFLFDADNGLVYLQQNGSNLFSGNAVTTNAIDTTLTYLPYIAQDGGGTNNGKLYINFGNPPDVFR